jgi:hypothetical protein
MVNLLLAFVLCYVLLKASAYAEQIETECQRCGRQLDPRGFCDYCDTNPLH